MNDRAPALLVAAWAAIIYAPAVTAGYVLDDDRAILLHPAVTGEAPLHEVFSREFWGAPLGEGWSSSYRPLSSLTFALEHRVTTHPGLHHLGNVVLFAALAYLVTRVARRWLSARGAALAGALFACLPIHVESVAGIVGRADVLAALFALGCLSLAQRTSARSLAGAVILYAAGLLSKESVALLPALALWLSVVDHRAQGGSRRDLALRLAPSIALGVVGIAYLWARSHWLSPALPSHFVDADNQLHGVSGPARWCGNLAVLGRYAELLLFPARLCADHTYADFVPPQCVGDLSSIWSLIGAAILALIAHDGIRAWRRRGRGHLVSFGLTYLLIGQWVIDLSVVIAERLMLWPSVWLAVAAGALLDRATGRRATWLIGVLLLLLSVRTVARTLDWRDEITLLQSSAEACPRAVHGRLNLAEALQRAGRPAEAVWHYAVAAAGRQSFPGAFDPPALEAEKRLPLSERLRRLPELVGAPDRRTYFAALHAFLLGRGAVAEAAIVSELAR